MNSGTRPAPMALGLRLALVNLGACGPSLPACPSTRLTPIDTASRLSLVEPGSGPMQAPDSPWWAQPPGPPQCQAGPHDPRLQASTSSPRLLTPPAPGQAQILGQHLKTSARLVLQPQDPGLPQQQVSIYGPRH